MKAFTNTGSRRLCCMMSFPGSFRVQFALNIKCHFKRFFNLWWERTSNILRLNHSALESLLWFNSIETPGVDFVWCRLCSGSYKHQGSKWWQVISKKEEILTQSSMIANIIANNNEALDGEIIAESFHISLPLRKDSAHYKQMKPACH